MQATERLPGFSGSNTEGGGVPDELNFETLVRIVGCKITFKIVCLMFIGVSLVQYFGCGLSRRRRTPDARRSRPPSC